MAGGADADDHLRKLDGCLAREILPHSPRRIRTAEQFTGPASGRTAPLGGRLPPLSAHRHPRRADFPRSRLRREEPLSGIGVFPLALHERGLLVARHHGGGQPHGIRGPEAGPGDGGGQRAGARRGQSQGNRQHGGQHRRDGHAAERRCGRRGRQRALQQRQLLLDREREDRLHAARGDQRRVRILPEIHLGAPHRIPHATQRVRHDLPRTGIGIPVRTGQPIRGPPRGDRAEFHLPGAGLRPHSRGAVPPDLHPQRSGRHGVDRFRGPFGAGHDPGFGDGRRSGAARPQRFAVGALCRGLGALQRLCRRDG